MDVYTTKEIADELKLHPETIRRAIRRGDLEALRVGGVLRITRDAVERWSRRVVEPRSDDREGG